MSQTALASPDVLVLDLGLPDIDGLTVCKRIRQMTDIPIVVLSATDAEDRKVAALDGGADDYITKPFGMAELEARIRTAIRHHTPEPAQRLPETLSLGPLHLDLVHHEAYLEGNKIELTAKEFEVLSFLARHAGKTCTHQMILTDIWGERYGERPNTCTPTCTAYARSSMTPRGPSYVPPQASATASSSNPTWRPSRDAVETPPPNGRVRPPRSKAEVLPGGWVPIRSAARCWCRARSQGYGGGTGQGHWPARGGPGGPRGSGGCRRRR